METINNEKSQPKADQPLAGKILLWVLALLIVGSVATTYWRIMIKKDYVIENQIDCDPYEKACFVWQCDPASTVEGEACTGDAEKDTWYYAIAKRSAANVPLCDPATDETCAPWTCAEGEKDCSETLCDQTTKVVQGVECSDPVQYALDNPVEDLSADEAGESTCAEGDTECLAAEADASTCAEGDTECLAAEEAAANAPVCDEGDAACLAAEAVDNACADGDEACLAKTATVCQDGPDGVKCPETKDAAVLETFR